MNSKRRRLLLALAAATFVAVSEALVRGLDADFRLLKPLLYYQDADVEVHRPVADERLYSLAPGTSAVLRGVKTNDPPRQISVNSLGMRDPERPARKPRDVFRIICLGDSNTYGAAVSDDQTYPRQLERRLNALGRGRFEVWNGGVSAYVLRQKVAAARLAVEAYDPDLVIIQHINNGRRAFLPGQAVEPYFARDVALFEEELYWVPWRGSALSRGLLAHSRLYRSLVIAANYNPDWVQRERPHPPGRYERPFDAEPNNRMNAAAMRGFCRDMRGRVPVVLLLTPKSHLGEGLSRLGIPQIDLISRLPSGAPAEFTEVHPPARVYRWYAEVAAKEIEALGLLPRGAAPNKSNRPAVPTGPRSPARASSSLP